MQSCVQYKAMFRSQTMTLLQWSSVSARVKTAAKIHAIFGATLALRVLRVSCVRVSTESRMSSCILPAIWSLIEISQQRRLVKIISYPLNLRRWNFHWSQQQEIDVTLTSPQELLKFLGPSPWGLPCGPRGGTRGVICGILARSFRFTPSTFAA